MNQLQNLLKEVLTGTKHVESAAVIHLKDGVVLAATPGFYLQDIQTVIDAFKNPRMTRTEGLYFQDKSYKCVRADEKSIYSKNNDHGLVIVKTISYLIAATYREGMYPSVCVEAVEKLGDYFKEKGK
ncbi:profilin-4 isoform X2 [Protopterus annectens]|uniref:profilin-4 isoform X2 n=1 Tax=Protopterus annectens TaxID=7888 RepID=UPI001CFA1168|nr:profilin-4 isoform X2 [Protopterus annectens]